MKIILHIGPPKTGTTALQGALIQNRKLLLESGALYFLDPTDQARALTTMYHPKTDMIPALRRNFWSMKEAQNWSKRAWDRLDVEIGKFKPHTLILSSEHFADQPLDFAALTNRLAQISDDVHVVGYLRDPASLYCSFIDQQIRGGVRLRQLRTPWDYEYPPVQRVKKWYDHYGADRTHIHSFDRARLHKGDIVADFMHLLNDGLGLTLPQIKFEGAQNASLSGAAAALLMTMNETFARNRKDGSDQALVKHRAGFVARLRKSQTLAALPRLALPDDSMKSMIRHNAREPLTWFNDTFFGGQPVMDTGAAPVAAAPKPPQQRAFMKDWILGYLDGEASRLAAQEVIG